MLFRFFYIPLQKIYFMVIDINKYLGRWHEIARIPNEFEPELTDVTAEYTLLDNGDIEVINSGYLHGKQKKMRGIAKTTENDDLLKVSFFKGLFYSDYRILAITEDYDYALVGGGKPDYLWILGRKKIMPTGVFCWFQEVALEHAYNVEKLKITK